MTTKTISRIRKSKEKMRKSVMVMAMVMVKAMKKESLSI